MKFYTDCSIYKGQILYRGWENNQRIHRKIAYEPYIFLSSDRDTGFKTLEGTFVKKKTFDSIRQAKDFINTYKDVDNFTYWGLTDFQYLYMYDEFPQEVSFDRNCINVVSIDIETWISDDGFESPYTACQPITLITMRKNGKTYSFGIKVYKSENESIDYFLCKDEKELLQKFIQKWIDLDPDIITGWNIDGYDIPYLINRITNVLGEESAKKLSPWNIIDVREYPTKWGDKNYEYTLRGITSLDYLRLYKKFSFKDQESFALNHIALVELEKQKLDYSEYSSLNDLYDKHFQKYVDYNILDAQLVDELDAKLGYINVVLSLSYMYKCNFSDTFATVKPWDVCIHAYLLNRGIVIPQYKHKMQTRELVGGYVMDPIISKYDWICSFDIKSSYPHQILQYNISPDTLIEKQYANQDELLEYFITGITNSSSKSLDYARNNNLVMAANGTMYLKDKQGFVPEVIDHFFKERSKYESLMNQSERDYNKSKDIKDKYLAAKYYSIQYALKIGLNSLYGALSNEYCRWYSIDLAEAITMSGQLALKWAMYNIDSYMNKILKTKNVKYSVYGDTDSVGAKSKININDSILTIEEYFDKCDGKYIHNDNFNEKYIKKINNDDITYSFNGKLNKNKILYVMKHKVKKDMYKIKLKDKEVIVTNDHSIIVQHRKNHKLIQIKPEKLNPEIHNLINISEKENIYEKNNKRKTNKRNKK